MQTVRTMRAPAPYKTDGTVSETQRNYARFARIVSQIKIGNQEAMDELYSELNTAREYFRSRLPMSEVDDSVQDCFVMVVRAIQSGQLREPERLMGFVRTIITRQYAACIHTKIRMRKSFVELDLLLLRDNGAMLEAGVLARERIDSIKPIMAGLSDRDREVLTRFYLHEQTIGQICSEMNVTETQFRLLKSRAKARFGRIGKQRFVQNDLNALVKRFQPTSHLTSSKDSSVCETPNGLVNQMAMKDRVKLRPKAVVRLTLPATFRTDSSF